MRIALLVAAVGLAGTHLFSSTAVADAKRFSNPTPLTVPRTAAPPGCPFTCPATTGEPYPSSLAVSGMSGTVTKVSVVLRNLSYAADEAADIDVMLVAPSGAAVMLMSDVCGVGSAASPPIDGVTLTFDDSAGGPIPADSPCTTGTYQPLDDDDDEEFPYTPTDTFPSAPAPPATTTPLSAFNGVVPNGTWSLYLIDDYPADPGGISGQFAGGWSLEITTDGQASGPPVPTTGPATTVAGPTTGAAPTTAVPTDTTTTTPVPTMAEEPISMPETVGEDTNLGQTQAAAGREEAPSERSLLLPGLLGAVVVAGLVLVALRRRRAGGGSTPARPS